MQQQTFTKKERLKSKKLIEDLFDNGSIINHYPFKVLYKPTDNPEFDSLAKIAVSVSKRNFKIAVHRNHIKRKIKEAYRKNKHLLYQTLTSKNQKLYFFVIYIAKENLDYITIENKMQTLIKALQSKINSA